MKKTTKILTVVLAVAILFSVFGISAYADNDPFEEAYLVATLNGDIFIIHSIISISGGQANTDITVEFYVPFSNYFNESNFVEPYPNYVPSEESYIISFSVMAISKLYGQDETYDYTNMPPVYDELGNKVCAATSPSYVLESMAAYQFFSTETFITITGQNNATYEAILCSVSYFWNV